MTNVWMRQKLSGQVVQVDDASGVFRAMRAERDPVTGHTLWEQTSDAHIAALLARVNAGDVREEDLGHADQPFNLNGPAALGLSPDPAPHKQLTPAEIDAGLTPEAKQTEEIDMFFRAQHGADKNQKEMLEERGELVEPFQARRARALIEGARRLAEEADTPEPYDDDLLPDEAGDGIDVEPPDEGQQQRSQRRARGQGGRTRGRAGGDAPRSGGKDPQTEGSKDEAKEGGS